MNRIAPPTLSALLEMKVERERSRNALFSRQIAPPSLNVRLFSKRVPTIVAPPPRNQSAPPRAPVTLAVKRQLLNTGKEYALKMTLLEEFELLRNVQLSNSGAEPLRLATAVKLEVKVQLRIVGL